MIYLKSEQEQFEKTKEAFRVKCVEMTRRASARVAERGKVSDLESPIHHRMSPEGMAHEVAKKATRIQVKQQPEGWAADPRILAGVVEECIDVINYARFLGALCLMLTEEQEPKARARKAPPPEPQQQRREQARRDKEAK